MSIRHAAATEYTDRHSSSSVVDWPVFYKAIELTATGGVSDSRMRRLQCHAE